MTKVCLGRFDRHLWCKNIINFDRQERGGQASIEIFGMTSKQKDSRQPDKQAGRREEKFFRCIVRHIKCEKAETRRIRKIGNTRGCQQEVPRKQPIAEEKRKFERRKN